MSVFGKSTKNSQRYYIPRYKQYSIISQYTLYRHIKIIQNRYYYLLLARPVMKITRLYKL